MNGYKSMYQLLPSNDAFLSGMNYVAKKGIKGRLARNDSMLRDQIDKLEEAFPDGVCAFPPDPNEIRTCMRGILQEKRHWTERFKRRGNEAISRLLKY